MVKDPFVDSSLSLRSVWEAKSVIGVVDFDMGRLECDRGRRFYTGPAHSQQLVVESSLRLRSVWEAKSVIGVVDFEMGRLKCDRCRRFYGGPGQAS